MVRIRNGNRAVAETRKHLHELAEVSGKESKTSAAIIEYLVRLGPESLIEGLGGNGVAAVFKGNGPGPAILLRCDIDALPLPETLKLPYGSSNSGVSHKCGHDGHMAIMLEVASRISESRPCHGTVVLLFQPEEETGSGAGKVLSDRRLAELKPEMAFALHNLPGFPAGSVIVGKGVFASASIGLTVKLRGESSHASQPHLGRSPAMAAAQLIESLAALPQTSLPMGAGSKVTVTHVKVGEEAFGTSPGEGMICATLRAYDDRSMQLLRERAELLSHSIASGWKLDCSTSWSQEFPVTMNHPDAVSILIKAAGNAGADIVEISGPFPWSEDFGHFTSLCPSVLFGLGAGEDHPALHSPHYDFPDQILSRGVDIFMEIIRGTLSEED